MISFVEIVPASVSLLPPTCRECDWFFQAGAHADEGDGTTREVWMERVVLEWGSVGLAAVEGSETLAVIQYAPLASLPRAGMLVPAAPSRSTLLFCLRYRVDGAEGVSRLLLHRALALLRERGVPEAHAYAIPLGSAPASGNLMGLDFLQANGFHVVREAQGVSLMRVELKGLVSVLADVGRAWRVARGLPGIPDPVGG